MNKHFTVVLTPEDTAKITALLGTFGGSVGGFATSLVRDYIHLSPDEIREFRQMIRVRIAGRNTAPGNGHGPSHAEPKRRHGHLV